MLSLGFYRSRSKSQDRIIIENALHHALISTIDKNCARDDYPSSLVNLSFNVSLVNFNSSKALHFSQLSCVVKFIMSMLRQNPGKSKITSDFAKMHIIPSQVPGDCHLCGKVFQDVLSHRLNSCSQYEAHHQVF